MSASAVNDGDSWQVLSWDAGERSIRHVVPINDARPHRLGLDCDCRPTLVVDNATIALVSHQAWDAREQFEPYFVG